MTDFGRWRSLQEIAEQRRDSCGPEDEVKLISEFLEWNRQLLERVDAEQGSLAPGHVFPEDQDLGTYIAHMARVIRPDALTGWRVFCQAASDSLARLEVQVHAPAPDVVLTAKVLDLQAQVDRLADQLAEERDQNALVGDLVCEQSEQLRRLSEKLEKLSETWSDVG